jgi:hypothetical protein
MEFSDGHMVNDGVKYALGLRGKAAADSKQARSGSCICTWRLCAQTVSSATAAAVKAASGRAW